MMATAAPPTWMADAECATGDPDLFFATDPFEVNLAVKVCRRCPVSDVCLQTALERREDHGVWGGQTADTRRRCWDSS